KLVRSQQVKVADNKVKPGTAQDLFRISHAGRTVDRNTIVGQNTFYQASGLRLRQQKRGKEIPGSKNFRPGPSHILRQVIWSHNNSVGQMLFGLRGSWTKRRLKDIHNHIWRDAAEITAH